MSSEQYKTNHIIGVTTFKVKDKTNFERVVEMLIEATEQILSRHEGFISSEIHKSLDRNRVQMYVIWKSKDVIEKLLKDPRMIIHINDIDRLASVDRSLYEMVYTKQI